MPMPAELLAGHSHKPRFLGTYPLTHAHSQDEPKAETRRSPGKSDRPPRVLETCPATPDSVP